MKRILPPLAALAALSLCALGCGEESSNPVASVQVQPAQVRLGHAEVQTVRLNWSPVLPLGEDAGQPMVFVHLLDAKNKVVRTFDHPFPQRWREGTPVSYDVKLHQSALAPPLAPGTYRLTLGLYGRDNRRWALQGLGEEIDRQEYAAAQVEVPAQDPGPTFNFSNTWLPIEPGGDRQLLARRWLVGRGGIRMPDVGGPGAVYLVLQIPPAEGQGEKLVLKEGASIPSVLLRGTCGPVETSISGPGKHEIEIPIGGPAPKGTSCRIILLPNYHLESPSVKDRRAVLLENVAWIPAAAGRRPQAPAAAPAAPTAPAEPEDDAGSEED